MRMPIPLRIREELENDPYMTRCILEFLPPCNGRIEWQHAMTYAGKRVNELYTILPLCQKHHKEQGAFRSQQEWAIRERILHFGAGKKFATKYPKSNLIDLLR